MGNNLSSPDILHKRKRSATSDAKATLPEPIKNLLNELYLRGPATVGIFRKSPNAKDCRELRQKLETDSRSSIEQFQVNVIASVFKEWLRSLPDCLLMSRLYPQWIAVAKLIEPLHQHQQHINRLHQSQSLDDSYSDNTISGNTSLRPSRSPLTDNGQMLDRAHSCSTISEFSINKSLNDACLSPYSSVPSEAPQLPKMSKFALTERHSECIRIVRQLLDALNESNLILLRSFICVLWHVANNSEQNKMSANNLGVCVGQSLLNDEHQSSCKSGSSTFRKRHRRTRSQCILSSTLSLTNCASTQSGSFLKSNSAQETAKYVPMLVAFMIENAPALFGQDITSIFAQEDSQHSSEIESDSNTVQMDLTLEKENLLITSPHSSFDQVDCGTQEAGASPSSPDSSRADITNDEDNKRKDSPKRQQIVVESRFPTNEQHEPQQDGNNNNIISQNERVVDDDSTTTSILIVNHTPKKRQQSQSLITADTQPRPLSATESTSSSRASSSTSGVHSESPAFSSEVESQTNTRLTASLSSPSPSSVSSPLSVSSSTSPIQEPQRATDLCSTESSQPNGTHSSSKRPQLTEAPSRPSIVNSDPLKYQNRHSMNRYSTFMGVLNRVPKIPVQFTTSNYGGEAIIYNPKPSAQQTNSNQLVDHYGVYSNNSYEPSVDSLPNNNSVISVKPLNSMQTQQQKQNQYHTISTRNQQELRDQRLKEFLAHQHQHHPLVSTPSLPYLPQSNYASRDRSHITPGQQVNYETHVPASKSYAQRQQQYQHPVFYSTSNLSSLQYQQQHDRYLLYQRASLEPQRSHVMSLRDYYLSLQQQNQQRQQQQQLGSHRARLHEQQSQLLSQKQRAATLNKLHQTSQQHPHQDQHLIVQGQYLANNNQRHIQPIPKNAHISSVGMTTHQTIQRPQPRMAKIRQNQFNGIYVKKSNSICSTNLLSATAAGSASVMLNKPIPGSKIKLSSSGHSSDDSDESINDWMESTMV